MPGLLNTKPGWPHYGAQIWIFIRQSGIPLLYIYLFLPTKVLKISLFVWKLWKKIKIITIYMYHHA
jgi:hypothetical protein